MENFQPHSGTLPAADKSPRDIERNLDGYKVDVMSIPDESVFRLLR